MELDAKRQQAQAMASFPPLPDALLYLIRQDTVRMAEADEPNHNSSWDYAISPDGQSAIGVSGDPDDLGVVFRFDLKTGLKLYGRIFFHHADMPGLIGASNEPHTVAWSADGKSVAIGVRDRLACVYRFVLA